MRSRVVATAGLPDDALRRHWQFRDANLWIEMHTGRRNVTFDLHAFEREIGRPLDALSQDLLELAAVTLMADLGIRRGRNEQWTRDIGLLLAVRCPDLWATLRPRIEDILGFLTGDNITLTLVARRPQPESAGLAETGWRTDLDCVCLLSGGLDSLAGALLLLQSGRKPLFVMHRDLNRRVAAAQRHVERLVRQRGSGPVARISLHPSGVAKPRHWFPDDDQREPTQRSRSFFLLCAALVAARVLGVREVFLFENGVMAQNLPLSPSRIGSQSTRTAHPRFIEGFARLAGEIFGGAWTIANPFLSRTKGEIVGEILTRELHPRDIRATVSCWQAGRLPRPCGGCVPCLLRRIAFAYAGVGDEATMTDVLSDPLPHRGTEGFGNLVDMLAMLTRVRGATESELASAFPALFEDSSRLMEQVALLRRFTEELKRALPYRFPLAWELAGETCK